MGDFIMLEIKNLVKSYGDNKVLKNVSFTCSRGQIISLTGNNPTIINYRSKILNQYAEWEQELKEREAAISQKEHAAGAGLEQGVHSEIDTD